MKTAVLDDLEDVVKQINATPIQPGILVNYTVGIFDLSSSTPMKLEGGHTFGTRTALTHNNICRKVIERLGGIVVKELGDGVLCKLNDPLKACLAAINVKKAVSLLDGVSTKCGLTLGEVEEIDISGNVDIIGNTVDRCARIQGHALKNQILIDETLYATVSSMLKDYADVIVSRPVTTNLAGIGNVDLFELSTKDQGLLKHIKVPILQEEGRPPIQDKVAFMMSAQREVIEIGIGLTTFSEYFVSRRETEFKRHVVELLKRGVNFRCVALDPDCPIARAYAKDRNELDLIDEIRQSLSALKKTKAEFDKSKYPGSFQVETYRHFPYFYAICIDANESDGRMRISHYMHSTKRAETPVLELSRISNSLAFNKYWQSINNLLST